MIGAAGRNVGKTSLAEALVRHQAGKGDVIGVKVTTIHGEGHTCPRGEEGCGVCSSVDGAFDLREETDPTGGKDTQRLLAAGARRVVWLCVHKRHLRAGVEALFDDIPSGVPVICESNTLRTEVEPDLFLMVRDRENEAIKSSAKAVLGQVDKVVTSTDKGRRLDFDSRSLEWTGSRWTFAPGD
jgi:hypothetical protein